MAAAADNQFPDVITHMLMHNEEPVRLNIARIDSTDSEEIQKIVLAIHGQIVGRSIVYAYSSKSIFLITPKQIWGANENDGVHEDEEGEQTVVKVAQFALLKFGHHGIEHHESVMESFDALSDPHKDPILRAIEFRAIEKAAS